MRLQLNEVLINELSSKALEECQADIKKYPAANSQTHATLLLQAKHTALQEAERAAEVPYNMQLQLIALKSTLEYRKALYAARIAGKEKRGYESGFLFSCHYSAVAKEKAATAMITTVESCMQDHKRLSKLDLKQFTGAANNGVLGDILATLKKLKTQFKQVNEVELQVLFIDGFFNSRPAAVNNSPSTETSEKDDVIESSMDIMAITHSYSPTEEDRAKSIERWIDETLQEEDERKRDAIEYVRSGLEL